LIKQEWDNILRICASLAQQTTSKSTLIRKLNAYPRKNNTQKAVEELDKALKIQHILQYIDQPELRQNIYKSLNRGEEYHSLKRAIFFDDQGQFKVNSEYEQFIWLESTRTDCPVHHLLKYLSVFKNSIEIRQGAGGCIDPKTRLSRSLETH